MSATAFEQETNETNPRWTLILRKPDEEDVITSVYAPTWPDAVTRANVQASDPVWDGWAPVVLRHEATV